MFDCFNRQRFEIFRRKNKIKKAITLYIANRAFSALRKSSAIYQHRQIFNLAFKMNKLKQNIKYGSVQIRNFIVFYCPTCHILTDIKKNITSYTDFTYSFRCIGKLVN